MIVYLKSLISFKTDSVCSKFTTNETNELKYILIETYRYLSEYELLLIKLDSNNSKLDKLKSLKNKINELICEM